VLLVQDHTQAIAPGDLGGADGDAEVEHWPRPTMGGSSPCLCWSLVPPVSVLGRGWPLGGGLWSGPHARLRS
jgi:hypothetical protein